MIHRLPDVSRSGGIVWDCGRGHLAVGLREFPLTY